MDNRTNTSGSLSYKQLAIQGLWKNNPAFVQLLGLCPLLAVSNTLANALSLGLATTVVLLLSNVLVSLMRFKTHTEIRLAIFVLIIGTITTCIELAMKALAFELYQMLGIFIPLIVTNCAVLGRAEAFATKNPCLGAALDGLMMGIGFTWIMCVLGACREVLGQGTLFSGMELLFGPRLGNIELTLTDTPILIFILPPGAFMTLGLLMALKNTLINSRTKIDSWTREEATRVG